MKILLSLAACSLVALSAISVPVQAARFEKAAPAPSTVCGDWFENNAEAAKAVVSEEAYTRGSGARWLRRQGAEGLKVLRETYAKEIQYHDNSPVAPEVIDATRWAHISAALDTVAQQHDAWSQGAPLFWFTNVEAAKAEAKKSEKPILSLRLLGKLTDEFSCANSRFFRAALYANADVAQYLSDNFVLLWTTERPVPKVTIDMGDGRVMTCTITGNSAHYVLDAEGRPLDCIPGLYSPVDFQVALQRGINLNKELSGKEAEERTRLLKLYHKSRQSAVNAALAADLRAAGIEIGEAKSSEEIKDTDADFLRKTGAVPAEVASRRAAGKSRIERPLFVLLGKFDRAEIDSKLNAEVWNKLAALHPCKLDAGSVKLMRSQNPENAAEASKRAVSKEAIEDPFFRLVQKFEQNIALDTVKNEYTFHAKIHEWFAGGEVETFEKFNERVYAELFFTPANDPWLGLKGDDYTGLKDAGISK